MSRPWRNSLFLPAAAAAALLGRSPAVARDAPPPPAPLDYAAAAHWVCRPDIPGACRDDLDAAVLGADGAARIERFRPAMRAKIDCFYVYPTVSLSPGLTADPQVSEAERRAVRQQVERLSSVCRLFAPVYRQFTVTSMSPGFPRQSREAGAAAARLERADVIAAWDHYVAHDNHGRGVVLIGHSQGAAMVVELIRARIDGQPIQRRLVSAILAGWSFTVPIGHETGGTFQAIAPCRSLAQTGCVIAFNSMRADRPMPADMVRRTPGQQQVCTNPAALAGGQAPLKPYLSTQGETIIASLTAPQPPWTRTGRPIQTPFVTLPGLYRAECRDDAHGVYLAVATAPQPGDQRTGAMTGDWMVDGAAEPTMGLHLIDLNLVQGNLVDVLREQARAYEARAAPAS